MALQEFFFQPAGDCTPKFCLRMILRGFSQDNLDCVGSVGELHEISKSEFQLIFGFIRDDLISKDLLASIKDIKSKQGKP